MSKYRNEDYDLVHGQILDDMRMEFETWRDIRARCKTEKNFSGEHIAKEKMERLLRRARKL